MDNRLVGLLQPEHARAGASRPPRRAIPQAEIPRPLIRFTREPDGEWTVVTADGRRHGNFPDIGDAFGFARQSCEAAPATLWLKVDGLVVVVLQDRNWTRPLIGTPRSHP
jgi:hypothetical protein